ncbi:putative HNHc nuclease [Aerococcaceae bacterium NML160702]|nr:putative HNHc nuclease [Aerococcaceae bacterium NML160702]
MEGTLLEFNNSDGTSKVTFRLPEEVDLQKIRHINGGKITADIHWVDTRMISDRQRGLIFGLIGDISDWTGYTTEYVEAFVKSYHKALRGLDTFSLARQNCTVQDANKFIEDLIEFCFENEIPFQNREYHKYGDKQKILFIMLMNRTCMVSGKPNADICHVEAVGMGRDRKTIDHTQHRFLSLSREYHTEQHIIGITAFLEKYHLVPIKLNQEQLQQLGVINSGRKENV